MLRLLMRLIPIVLGLAAAGAAWFVTQPGGLFSLGNSPRRSAALAGIAFAIVFVLTWLPGFVFERSRRKREAAEAAAQGDDETPMSFGPLPPIRPSAVTDARTPYVPQFADDDEPAAETEPAFAPAATARTENEPSAPGEAGAFAWPTMTAAELGQPEPADDVADEPAAVAPSPIPAAADPLASAPIDELLMRRKADLAAALQRVSSTAPAAPQPAAAPVEADPVAAAESPPPSEPAAEPEAAPEAAPAPAPEAPIAAAVVTPMPAYRPAANPRPAMPLPDMRARIAAIRRELD